ncbi:cation:proton antiporter [Agitococcus lubricus]|uniref:Transporter (CPA2 family) n=1 Tax=Agitococcus lubricus TaxID=1077255 RepID=A0A2T5J0A1_9GAMM|nr:cation:proton antiporter [Agitococcus lubricus]PTQ89691.1 transporter (CPA2 family) [Agitococcus lubricus]
MHAAGFIQDLAVIMIVAGIVTLIFHRFKQPVVLGYILAGVIIGPHTPPFSLIHEQDTVHTLAELGVMFLLFSLGLEFNIKKLARVGVAAVVAGIAEIVVMMWLGYQIGRWFGWQNMDALFLGAMLAISSTTIIIKALEELNLKHHRFAQLIFGILIVEDILAIAMIVLLTGIATSGALSTTAVMATLGELTLFMVVSLVVGILTIPRLLNYIDAFKSQEMLLISVLGLLFGFCLLVVKLEYSMALGAFVIGAIIAESRQVKKIEHLIEPIRDMFSAIFFVAIGLLFNPSVLFEYTIPIIVITVAVVVGKVVSCSVGAFVAGQDGRTSMRIGMGLAQIGEFSFIIASLGITLHVTSDFLYPIAVAVAAITTLLTPYLIRGADPIGQKLATWMPAKVIHVATAYTTWLQNIQPQGDSVMIAKIIRRILIHVFVNFALVVAIFISCAYFMDVVESYVPSLTIFAGLEKAVVWSGALLASLPFLIAAYRKLKALSMLLAEMSVKPDKAGQYNVQARTIISEVIPIVAILVMLLLISALSSSILPPANLLVAVLVLFAVLVPLLWGRFVRLHSRLQIALIETLDDDSQAH